MAEISGCGYICSECCFYNANACPSCSKENELSKDCNIITCLDEKNLPHCLKCAQRYRKGKVCEIYSSGLRHCPLRLKALKS